MAVLMVAMCQFPVSADIGANLHHVKRQMVMASERGARVAHFPEGSLSGYAGTDFETFVGFDWDRLHDATADISSQRTTARARTPKSLRHLRPYPARSSYAASAIALVSATGVLLVADSCQLRPIAGRGAVTL
jgi:predicted amidohydrolase